MAVFVGLGRKVTVTIRVADGVSEPSVVVVPDRRCVSFVSADVDIDSEAARMSDNDCDRGLVLRVRLRIFDEDAEVLLLPERVLVSDGEGERVAEGDCGQ